MSGAPLGTEMQVGHLVRSAALKFVESDTASLDAQLLLAEVLGKDRTWLYTWSDVAVSEEDNKQFQCLVSRRSAGEPIAHILGKREFWGLDLRCNNSTLIPRPETELLVELVLDLALPASASVLDLGTGTGAIVLALASERPSWILRAVDVSSDAVALARGNAERNQLSSVRIEQSDWFAAIEKSVGQSKQFDLIVSNPPYIDQKSNCLNEGDVQFEPISALVAENEGMADIDYITSQSVDYLNLGGWLLVEHGFDQKDRVQECFRRYDYQQIRTVDDLAGIPRVTMGRCSLNK